MPEKKSPPDRIFLQWEELADEYLVTWCVDQINDSDTAYVREGRVKALEHELNNKSQQLELVAYNLKRIADSMLEGDE